ncbi:hypothetical protein DNTS_035362, partial [Danionella cerebrum]
DQAGGTTNGGHPAKEEEEELKSVKIPRGSIPTYLPGDVLKEVAPSLLKTPESSGIVDSHPRLVQSTKTNLEASSSQRPAAELKKLLKANTLDMGDLSHRLEREKQRGQSVEVSDSTDKHDSPRPVERLSESKSPTGSSLTNAHKPAFTFNRDTDLLKMKRTCLRHSESDRTSDSSPQSNHMYTSTKRNQEVVPSSVSNTSEDKKVLSRQEELKERARLLLEQARRDAAMKAGNKSTSNAQSPTHSPQIVDVS